MKRLLVVFGTRPEAIKLCPLILELRKREEIKTFVCITGQHREMVNSVLDFFDVKADFDLDIMKEGQSLIDICASVMVKIGRVMDEACPSAVLVQGDTSSAFGAALCAFYKKIPVCHVEAGLRSGNIFSPYPEEFNRRAISMISAMDFAPTESAKENLIGEGKASGKIFVCGNTGIDALRYTLKDDYCHPELIWARNSRLIILTAHRRENQGAAMENMFRAVRRAVGEHSDVKVIFPIHANPAVRKLAFEILDGCSRIRIIEPLGVMDFHNFLSRCYMIISDSGGIQEEAAYLGKPLLLLRDTTERPEAEKIGVMRLLGTEEENIYRGICSSLHSGENKQTCKRSLCFGDGYSSVRIAEILVKLL